jgi:sigma-70-like protein
VGTIIAPGGEHRVAKLPIGQASQHRRLHHGHDFASVRPDHREAEDQGIVLLRDVEGLSQQDVSQITGLSIGAVKTRTHRARLVLPKRLGEYLSDRPLSDERPATPDWRKFLERCGCNRSGAISIVMGDGHATGAGYPVRSSSRRSPVKWGRRSCGNGS